MNSFQTEQNIGEDRQSASQLLAIGREVLCVSKKIAFAGTLGFPLALSKAVFKGSGLDPVLSEKRLWELLGDTLLNCIDQLGPVYGKLGQIAISRMEEQGFQQSLGLDRLYHSWPPIPFAEVEEVLDREIPEWRQEFIVESCPLGVASMAQVHAAVDEQGKEWVIKVIKPASRKRLGETIQALEQLLKLAAPMKLSARGSRMHDEITELLKSLRKETRLDLEKRNLNRMRSKLEGKKQDALRLPKTYDRFCTPQVLVIERFRGVAMSEVIAGRSHLKPEQRRKLAKQVLQELMLQVFEVGLFHGDPHAGNLILLEDGSVGLFDWGLTGELRESDRKHISSILKALLLADFNRLTDALLELAQESQAETTREAIEAEMRRVADILEDCRKRNTKASFGELTEACLEGCDSLGISMPDGLLMMVKSLLTIEGLARGIDPELSFARAAGPILLKAAKPSLIDLFSMGKRLPKLMKKVLVAS